jgi:hypothetical protein
VTHARRWLWRASFVWLVVTAGETPALAQAEEIEPRIIGERGTTLVGFAGFVDKFYSSEEILPVNYTAQVDIARFITGHFAVRGGLVGTGSFNGENADQLPSGAGAPALHALTGLLYYVTPKSMVSLYGGAEYWAQLTQRTSPDSGSLLGKAGIQAAASSRISFFVEAGYGIRLTRDDEDQLMSRVAGQIGIRLKF